MRGQRKGWLHMWGLVLIHKICKITEKVALGCRVWWGRFVLTLSLRATAAPMPTSTPGGIALFAPAHTYAALVGPGPTSAIRGAALSAPAHLSATPAHMYAALSAPVPREPALPHVPHAAQVASQHLSLLQGGTHSLALRVRSGCS